MYLYQPARLFVLVMAGQHSICSADDAMKGLENLDHQIGVAKRVAQASRVVKTDSHVYQLWTTPKGYFWAPKGQNLPFLVAELELKYVERDQQPMVQSEDIVLDCGANVGVFTREALKAGARLVVAVEPSPRSIECLRRNFAKEVAAGRVIIYQKVFGIKMIFSRFTRVPLPLRTVSLSLERVPVKG